MKPPDWFIILDRWTKEGLGRTGITLPFLVGALAFKAGTAFDDEVFVKGLISDMCTHPVDDYVTEIAWCDDIKAPVMSIKRLDSPDRMESPYIICAENVNRDVLVFSRNLKENLGGSSASELLKLFIADAMPHIQSHRYSRNKIPNTDKYVYGNYLPGEITLIHDAIMS